MTKWRSDYDQLEGCIRNRQRHGRYISWIREIQCICEFMGRSYGCEVDVLAEVLSSVGLNTRRYVAWWRRIDV